MGSGGGGTTASRGVPAQEKIAVSQNAVVIAGPRGFCVDPSGTQANSSTPFVMLGNCATISGRENAPQPTARAVLTATVAEPDPTLQVAGAGAELQAFFQSEAGRAALARDGDPGKVQVHDSFEEDGIFYIRATDSGNGPVANLSKDQWRAYMDVNNRLVSASVLHFENSPLPAEQGLEVLRVFTSRIQQESPADGQTAVIAPPVTQPVQAPPVAPRAAPAREPSKAPLSGVGLFRRILG